MSGYVDILALMTSADIPNDQACRAAFGAVWERLSELQKRSSAVRLFAVSVFEMLRAGVKPPRGEIGRFTIDVLDAIEAHFGISIKARTFARWRRRYRDGGAAALICWRGRRRYGEHPAPSLLLALLDGLRRGRELGSLHREVLARARVEGLVWPADVAAVERMLSELGASGSPGERADLPASFWESRFN